MIFTIGDRVKNITDPDQKIGEVVEIVEANNTVYVEYDNGVKCIDADDLILSFDDTKTRFDQAGPLKGYDKLTGKDYYYDEHYAKLDVQPIEIMQQCMTPVEFKGFLRGNIIKYMCRAGKKSGESASKDRTKAERYREWLLQAEAGLTIDPRI